MKILIDQRDGLGNQIFQYAAGLYFSNKYHASLEIVLEPEQRASSFNHPRPFLLSKFSIAAPTRQRTSWDRLMCSVAGHKKPLAESARLLSRTKFYKQDFQTYNQFLPSLPVTPSIKNLYLNGNFQAYQFADGIEQELRSQMGLREAMSEASLKVLAEIEASENAVSLHVRRGDYLLHNGGKSILPMSFYQNAIETIQANVPNPTYFVFSDDIGFARENLPRLERAVFVGHNSEETAHEDLRLMSACKHHIIANSTFSWWGAWLNHSPTKLVVIPNLWFNLNPIQPDLVPPAWKCVPVHG